MMSSVGGNSEGLGANGARGMLWLRNRPIVGGGKQVNGGSVRDSGHCLLPWTPAATGDHLM